MTIDEAIKHAEEVAKDKTNLASILWDTKEKARLKESAFEHLQLAEWLKELQAHREAWGKAKRTVKAYLLLEEFGSAYQDDIENLIEGCIPKEGDNE